MKNSPKLNLDAIVLSCHFRYNIVIFSIIGTKYSYDKFDLMENKWINLLRKN